MQGSSDSTGHMLMSVLLPLPLTLTTQNRVAAGWVQQVRPGQCLQRCRSWNLLLFRAFVSTASCKHCASGKGWHAGCMQLGGVMLPGHSYDPLALHVVLIFFCHP